MNLIEKFEHIANWTSENFSGEINKINQESGEKDFAKIEKMIDENLPKDFIEIYSKFNGEKGKSNGILFGLEFISTEKIISQLEFSSSLIKPKERKIINKNHSDKILSEIVNLFIKSIPTKRKLGVFKIKWKTAKAFIFGQLNKKISVTYENETTAESFLNESYSNKVSKLATELKNIEKKHYNWDNLEFKIMQNGKYSVERKDYIWENEIDFSSCPNNTIKKKYFHIKWLPLFHDFGGNFIGIDFDPDENGKKGQIIIYGRDEEKMIVIAENLQDFLDLSIKEMKENPNQFTSENHIHEVYKRIKNCA